MSDFTDLLNTLSSLKGRSVTTSQNVSPEATQALLNNLIANQSNGIGAILAAHRSSGLRGSSNSSDAITTLLAKAAAQAQLASSSTTQKQSGIMSGNEAKILGLAGMAYPYAKPLVSPLVDAAKQKVTDWASQLYGTDQTAISNNLSDVGVNTMQSGAPVSMFGDSGGADIASSALMDQGISGSSASEAGGWMNSVGDFFSNLFGGTSSGAASGGLVINNGKVKTNSGIPVIDSGSINSDIGTSTAATVTANPSAVGSSLTPAQHDAINAAALGVMGKMAVQGIQGNVLGAILGMARGINNLNNMAVAFEGDNAVAKGAKARQAQIDALQANMTPLSPAEIAAIVANPQDIAVSSADASGAGGNTSSAIGAVGGFGAADSGASGSSGTSTAACGGKINKAAKGGMVTLSEDALLKLIQSSSKQEEGQEDKMMKKDAGDKQDGCDMGGMKGKECNKAAVGGSVVGDNNPGKDDRWVQLDGGEFVIPAKVVAAIGREPFDNLLAKFGFPTGRNVTGVPIK